MAEAEDVLQDAARHATIFAQKLWQRHRSQPAGPPTTQLLDVAERLDVLIGAIFNIHYPIRVAQVPARRTFLASLFKYQHLPPPAHAIPATDGFSLWLPAELVDEHPEIALERFRVMGLQQAMRAHRGSATIFTSATAERPELTPLNRDLYLLLEATAADAALLEQLPGLAPAIARTRHAALTRRPELTRLAPWFRPVETLLRTVLSSPDLARPAGLPLCATPAASLEAAHELALQLSAPHMRRSRWGDAALLKDEWTGDLITSTAQASAFRPAGEDDDDTDDDRLPRSARLPRSPKVREAVEGEDDEKQGIWMVQSGAPIEGAEDPMGMQRPTDRDDQTPAEEFADSLSELAEARLVSTPGRPKDVLLSDDPPEGQATVEPRSPSPETTKLTYPEWDYRITAYRNPGATVHLLTPRLGSQQWVDTIQEQHRSVLHAIRRHFEMLRPERIRLRRQPEGDNIDLDAYIDALADKQANHTMAQGLYETQRPGKRNMAIMLLIDISGSTDSWLSSQQRVIDVEREALLLVCIALESLGEAYSVQAFSGEGPDGVTVSAIKRYDEHYGPEVALRIAALEPERYTRTGAALRHASALLMAQPAEHHLLLLLSDGKPNDADDYEGRYGVEDMRQAVTEAKLQGIFPFCLTIDRQAANYLSGIFGQGQYALLPRPEMLPTVLLDWMRRLLAR